MVDYAYIVIDTFTKHFVSSKKIVKRYGDTLRR